MRAHCVLRKDKCESSKQGHCGFEGGWVDFDQSEGVRARGCLPEAPDRDRAGGKTGSGGFGAKACDQRSRTQCTPDRAQSECTRSRSVVVDRRAAFGSDLDAASRSHPGFGRRAQRTRDGFAIFRRSAAVSVASGVAGSLQSAVLLAVGLGASRCELLKDVPGYFEEDPRANARAAPLPSLSFEKALGMAERGCELVQQRALAAAADAGLPLVVRSLDEGATSSVISPRTKQTSPEPDREPVTADT